MTRFFLAATPFFLAACMSQPPAPAEDRSSSSASTAGVQVAQPSGPGYYTVKRGDSLYRIAVANGRDPKDIALWNNLTNVNAIKEGQVLRVAPPNAPESTAGVVANPVVEKPLVESRPLDAVPVAPPAAALENGSGHLIREPKVGKVPYSDEAYARLNQLPDGPKVVESKPEDVAKATNQSQPEDNSWVWPSSGKVTAPYNIKGNKGFDIEGELGDPVFAAADGKVTYVGASIKGYGNFIVINHSAGFNTVYAHNRKILVKEKDMVTKGQKIAEMGNSDADAVKLHFEMRKQGKPVDPTIYLPKR